MNKILDEMSLPLLQLVMLIGLSLFVGWQQWQLTSVRGNQKSIEYQIRSLEETLVTAETLASFNASMLRIESQLSRVLGGVAGDDNRQEENSPRQEKN